MRRLAFMLLTLTMPLLAQVIGLAQEHSERVIPPKSASLPPPFSRFSASDVLNQIFDGYDPSTGRVATILNADEQPALIRINEAKLWKAQGRQHVVVLVELAADDEQFSERGLCGGCDTYVILAVLKKDGGHLALVAKQMPPPSSRPDEGPEPPYGPMMYTSRSRLSLDLAPYQLTARERLIGVRLAHKWLPSETYSTVLQLYRIEGQRLREVFSERVIDRSYPTHQRGKGQTVAKMISTVRPVPSGQGFYDLEIDKTILYCSDTNEDWDCDTRDASVRRVRGPKELWRFNGERFNEARTPNRP